MISKRAFAREAYTKAWNTRSPEDRLNAIIDTINGMNELRKFPFDYGYWCERLENNYPNTNATTKDE